MKNFHYLLLALVFFACKKDKDPEIEKPEESKKIYFTGITRTNSSGIIISTDSTDWKFNDTWVEQEEKLFSTTNETVCTTPHTHNIFAYPNPSDGIFSLYVKKDSATHVQIRLVDQDFKVILSRDTVFTGISLINVKATAPKDTIRMYYKFIDGTCVRKGHGDLLIQ